MIIVALTDLHGSTDHLSTATTDLAAADLVLLCGDITHFGHRADAARVIEAVRTYNQRILAVAGNCDHPDVADSLLEEDIDLHRRHLMVGGIAFAGLGGALPGPGWSPNQYSETEARRMLDEIAIGLPPDVPSVLVSHQPPFDTATDLVRVGHHVGSEAVLGFIRHQQPLYCFTGHIHESRGVDAVGLTTVINPGPFRHGHYAVVDTERETVNLRQVATGG